MAIKKPDIWRFRDHPRPDGSREYLGGTVCVATVVAPGGPGAALERRRLAPIQLRGAVFVITLSFKDHHGNDLGALHLKIMGSRAAWTLSRSGDVLVILCYPAAKITVL
jgi:hypothetical protein